MYNSSVVSTFSLLRTYFLLIMLHHLIGHVRNKKHINLISEMKMKTIWFIY